MARHVIGRRIRLPAIHAITTLLKCSLHVRRSVSFRQQIVCRNRIPRRQAADEKRRDETRRDETVGVRGLLVDDRHVRTAQLSFTTGPADRQHKIYMYAQSLYSKWQRHPSFPVSPQPKYFIHSFIHSFIHLTQTITKTHAKHKYTRHSTHFAKTRRFNSHHSQSRSFHFDSQLKTEIGQLASVGMSH